MMKYLTIKHEVYHINCKMKFYFIFFHLKHLESLLNFFYNTSTDSPNLDKTLYFKVTLKFTFELIILKLCWQMHLTRNGLLGLR